MATKTATIENPLLHPIAGTTLTILAGISFQVTCILLPLVGPSGAVTPHAQKNFITFLAVLMVTLLLSLAATTSKLARREIDESPFPILSTTLSALSVLLLLALFMGLLKI